MNNSIKPYKFSLLTVTLITLLSACGGSGDNNTTVKETENKHPTVVITGISEVESGTEVRLTSTASDPDGSIVSYQWSQKSGDMVFMRDKDQANTTFTAPVVDTDTTLEFELVVTDNKGAKATDTVSVKVKGAVQTQSRYASCNVELASSVLETYQQTMNFESKIALKKWLCSAPVQEGDALAKNVRDIFSLEVNDAKLNGWKSTHCSDEDRDFEGSKSSHVLLQNANESASTSWTQCMQNTNALACYATQADRTLSHNASSIVFKIDVKAEGGKLLNANVVTTNLTAVDSVPNALETGETDLHFKVDDVTSESHFELTGNTNNENVSCTYSVPTKPTIDASACEVFRAQSLAQGKLSQREYDYLKESEQVPLFSSKNGTLIGNYSCSLYSN